MAFYVDNRSSFLFAGDESKELVNSSSRYHDADAQNKKIVVFEVPRYAGNNENKRITRCNIELDTIAFHYEDRVIYYCSPYDRIYKFVSRPAPAYLDRFTYVHFTDAQMTFDAEPNAIWVVDADASYQMILSLISFSKMKNCDKLIFFVHEQNKSLLKLLRGTSQ